MGDDGKLLREWSILYFWIKSVWKRIGGDIYISWLVGRNFRGWKGRKILEGVG